MRMKILWLLFFLTNFNLYSQSVTNSFFELSSPEKWWVIFHPFKAKKALNISKDVLKTTDSIGQLGEIDKDLNGGHLDAFKHSYWMATLALNIGSKPALKLGMAHEKGNYKAFKKSKLEDGFSPDKLSSDMDMYNNKIGIYLANEYSHLSKVDFIEIVIENIKDGKLKIIKKDTSGNFLNCDGEIIPTEILIGNWENKKCLMASNYH